MRNMLTTSGEGRTGFPLDDISTKKEYETPRSAWRKQYWQKSTPWATDRRVYTGGAMYQTSLKPHTRNYNGTSRWEYDPTLEGMHNSEDVVRQICRDILIGASATFCNDAWCPEQVLISFSIDLSEQQIQALMVDFGGVVRAPSNPLNQFRGHGSDVRDQGPLVRQGPEAELMVQGRGCKSQNFTQPCPGCISQLPVVI
eukprot:2796571-Rhodomonas_salina.2